MAQENVETDGNLPHRYHEQTGRRLDSEEGRPPYMLVDHRSSDILRCININVMLSCSQPPKTLKLLSRHKPKGCSP
jgi:hypothetical protein